MKTPETDLLEAGFDAFWAEWPRKVSRIDAKKAWRALAKAGRLPPIETIVAAVRAQCRLPQWREQGGRFIPYPGKWLRGESWGDEVAGAPRPAPAAPSGRPRETAEASLSPEEIALCRRGRAYVRIESAVRDGVMPDAADLALVRPDFLSQTCRRLGVAAESLQPSTDKEPTHGRP